jgi:hypothetical protein
MNILYLILAAALVVDSPEQAVVKVGNGCSGVCVSDSGIVLTVKHCGTDDRVSIEFADGTNAMATLLVVGQGADSCIAYDCDGAGFPFLQVSEKVPAVGDAVHSYGYPGPARSLVLSSGTVTGGAEVTGVRGNYMTNNTTLICHPGHSGGPLLGESQQVYGVLSTSDFKTASQFISHGETLRVYRAALKLADGTVVKYARRKVIAFTTSSCPPCARLKVDVLAGRFNQFDIQFVTFDEATASWDRPELVGEFFAACHPKENDLAFPLLWVQGTESYRVGYDPDTRGGLIGWLAGVFDGLGKMIIGERPVTQFPPINGTPIQPQPQPDPIGEPQPAPQISIALASVADLKMQLLAAKADLELLKSANPIDKLRGIVALKSDVTELKATAETALAEVRRTKDDATEHPLQYVWGLFGILSGLAHRRFAA